MIYRLDLHNHSCLSPCGSLEMSPRRLVEEAFRRDIKILALSDHNAPYNLPAFGECCLERGITPLFGMEVTAQEEAHFLCLYGDLSPAMEMGESIYKRLIALPNDPATLGDQIIVDRNENILGELDKNLVNGSVDIPMDELLEMVHAQGGLFIPAHIDRPFFSIKSQLGFLPPGDYDALEVLQSPCPLNTGGYREITGSDAHYPGDVGRRFFELDLPSPSFKALRDTLRGA